MYKIKTNKNIKDLLTDLYRNGKREIRVNAWKGLITILESINLLSKSSISIQHQERRLNAAELLAEETSLPPPVKILTFIYFIVPKQLGNSKKKLGSPRVFGLEERLTTPPPSLLFSYSGLTAEKFGTG